MADPTGGELVYPRGRIHKDLFPERSLEELVQDIEIWLREGMTSARVLALAEADRPAAAKVWAEYRAFDSACIALAANPATHAETDSGSSSYAKDQRDTICSLATRALASFDQLAPPLTSVIGAQRTGGSTVYNDFSW